ncbi:MAG: FtsW/RodA/SpoVE family cell cycle protein [Prevotellaceae bacterium]|nr:FtsW/RodA/SpoVE family cell cycle protein [Prevotellaceae bacterium]
MNFFSKYIELKGDKGIWIAVGLLAIFSLLVVYSSTANITLRANVSPFGYFIKHFAFLAVGFIIIYVLSRVRYTIFMSAAKLGYYASLALLLAMLVLGQTYNQAARTLAGFQPAELAKVALILFMAERITAKQEMIKSFGQGFWRVLWPFSLTCLIIFMSNFSTAAILAITCMVMVFVGRAKLVHLLATVLTVAALFAALMGFTHAVVTFTDGMGRTNQPLSGFWKTSQTVINKTRLHTMYSRVTAYASSDSEANRNSRTQADYAHAALVAGGGFWGVGPGNSQMKYRLPEAFSDFVYAIVVEEYGLVSSIFLVVLYLIIMFRVGVIVRRANRFFPAMLAIGIGTQITLQALVHVWVVVGLLPVTGQNLPFISQGGSSIIFTCIMLGMLLSVSRYVDEQEAEEAVAAEQIAVAKPMPEPVVAT